MEANRYSFIGKFIDFVFFKISRVAILIAIPMIIYAPVYNGKYEYFIFLRIFVCWTSIYYFVIVGTDEISGINKNISLIYLVMAIFYNPIIFFQFSRTMWNRFDILYGALLIYTLFRELINIIRTKMK